MQENDNKQSADILISGYLKGELTSDETRELINWIKLSKANKQYFDECCEVWITAKASLKNPGYRVQEGFWKFKHRIETGKELRIDSNKTSLSKVILRYAAIIIIAFSSSGILFYYLGKNQVISTERSFNELVVPLGSQAQFFLSDGTEITLNAGSTLKYDNLFNISERIVQLEGEGYFKVAEDTSKPFIVKTPFLNVTALGTEFNVKAYAGDKTVETTLVKGSVEIEPVNYISNNEITILKQNQKFTYFKEGSGIVDETLETKKETGNAIQPLKIQKNIEVHRSVKENINVEPVVSWKENRWIFEQQSLSQIAIELERKFDVEINFESERLKTFSFTGILIAEPIDQVLKVMSDAAPINYKLEGRVITLYENKNFEERNKNLYN